MYIWQSLCILSLYSIINLYVGKNVLNILYILIPYLVYSEKDTPQCFVLRHHKCYIESLEYNIAPYILPQY